MRDGARVSSVDAEQKYSRRKLAAYRKKVSKSSNAEYFKLIVHCFGEKAIDRTENAFKLLHSDKTNEGSI
jgi:hypothetical protein